jgi:hypothetical protein
MQYGQKPWQEQGLGASQYRDYIKGSVTAWNHIMNAPSDLSMKNDEVLRVELAVFRREHRDLDDAIHALQEKGTADQLTVRRLKKKKLRLKDMIANLEDRLTPDITA